ncbi:hypothetical protein PR202_ga28432 [Eleusine coracana subsp. coracana]|uniref:non-specific serine/threonine protein kinase n=1 Tax=Eleusine coracana subsp. coracana TaxID=191504 RepID=A0AAV5DKC5_ELECO|nr:hypothetical protein PR202_ga28432 [Eleusine coracana subsp. coracana]
MGLVNDRNNGNASNHILAVEIDTVQNNEFSDINSNHVGININGLHSMNSSSAGYYDDKTGNFYNLTLMSSEVMRVWVHYDEESMKLDVTLAPVKMVKPARPLVSATCNLSQVLSEESFIGFSSATGMVNTRHYIIGWSFGTNASAPPIDTAKLPRLPRVGPKDDSRFLDIILPLATASFLLTVSMVAFLLVRRHLRYAEVHEDWEVEFGPHRFSYKDLYDASEGFKDKHLIGIGGFGRVYKAVLPESKMEVAIKRLAHDSKQGMKEFIAESRSTVNHHPGSTRSLFFFFLSSLIVRDMESLCSFLLLSLNIAVLCTGENQFVYSGFTGTKLILDGAATVTPDDLLELTNETANMKGHAINPIPFHFRKTLNSVVQSFSVAFVFGIVSLHPDLSAHGMTFLVAPSKNFSTALPSQYLGLFNPQNNGKIKNHIFAIELDTNLNKEFHDINNNHVGIDVNGLQSVQSHDAGYYDKDGMFQNLALASHEVMQVWVDYDMQYTRINVTMAPIKMRKPTRPLITTTYNLSQVLTDPAYIGFSAATSPINSRHYVLGWSFGLNSPAPAINTSKLPKLPRLGPNPRSKILEIILPLASAALISVVIIAIFIVKWRQYIYAEVREDWESEFGPHRFAYKDLFNATNGFDKSNLLGAGGFGRVYRGIFPVSKIEIAVKKVSHESRQGMKEFVAEVVSIGCLRHRNLVKLLGYCRRKGELLLVYDYMSNGSLDKYLYCDKGKPTLDWATRLHIIQGVACGLHYIHEKWEKVLIHRDIKAGNVLLDEKMNGRLGDFGLARLYDHGTDLQTTHVVGTMGYLAPELIHTGKASPLSDVFAFGIFLLEVTCGQRPVRQNTNDSHVMLVDWVLQHCQSKTLIETVDTRLDGNFNMDEACLLLKLGLLCSHPFTNARPSMRLVIQYLNGDVPLPDATLMDPNFRILAMMESEGSDLAIMPYEHLMTSVGTISVLSGGR